MLYIVQRVRRVTGTCLDCKLCRESELSLLPTWNLMVPMMKSVCLASDWIYLSYLHHARALVRDADIAQFETNEQKEKKIHT